MKRTSLVLSTGFAMFSMFFGSGNLVFPLLVGQQSGGHFLWAALGIFLTGVAVPFLGVFGMMLYRGSSKEFFGSIGAKGTFLFSLGALALMGPFGVLARCLTVAHGALELVFPSASLVFTSLTLCALIYWLTANKNRIIPILGSVLTPLLLLSVAAIALSAILSSSFPEFSMKVTSWNSFKNGFFQGYQTMDLLAAFFFSTFVIHQLQTGKLQDVCEKSSLKVFLKSAAMGGGLLTIVYFCLVLLGSMYAEDLIAARPQDMIGLIALKTLGVFAAPVVCIAIVLACLTTAVVLASLFADFLHKEVSRSKLGRKTSLLVTLFIGFLVSTLDFSGIASFLGPLMEMIYPALIVLTILNILHKYLGFKNSHWPVTATLIARILTAF
jgi:LIVCS family branched-chain amino acid:cation transporter